MHSKNIGDKYIERQGFIMKISTKGRYALRMMYDMAINDSGSAMPLKEIAKRQNISIKYLEQIYATMEFETVIAILQKGDDSFQLAELLMAERPEIICSLDMAGFDLDTLLETYYYNICCAKQMHIIMNQQLL